MPHLKLSQPAEKLYYSAADAPALGKVNTDKILQMVADLDVANSDLEHYVTGWMGLNSVIVVRNYQDKRGTANGFVLNKGNRHRLSVQSIEFRIPKVVLWMSFRRRPRVMELITYEALEGELNGMQQYRNILDKDLLQQLEQDWLDLNDYLGEACWQLENGRPLWQQLHQKITPEAIEKLANAAVFHHKNLQSDGEFSGFWAGNYFFAIRSPSAKNPNPAIMISWRENETDIGSYVFDVVEDMQGERRLSPCIRPRKGAEHFILNPFDAVHLQRAIALFDITHIYLAAD
ncbi:hypothetical protein [Yersinia ruckeri]|uniref:hypothetical protein n=1 Tax=Yersinia ruckeri TaxID=29486 RepID=UPI0005382DCC|nr:hypothetical protein [Yersinia ruckeri]AKA37937.1 hypothetical protein UGYR_05710 [Yersinia ruckeri]AUQ42326.1 hypothetical protein NJ56_10700 [Yersinia ruckeri]ELI6450964.1 hypothetical protein [Yersinia ruckeri]MCW6527459.1 hypothetical protein [Yersinia ruckeri]MCW6560977.1 hypothetical protein [Yersinia ruckeri]